MGPSLEEIEGDQSCLCFTRLPLFSLLFEFWWGEGKFEFWVGGFGAGKGKRRADVYWPQWNWTRRHELISSRHSKMVEGDEE